MTSEHGLLGKPVRFEKGTPLERRGLSGGLALVLLALLACKNKDEASTVAQPAAPPSPVSENPQGNFPEATATAAAAATTAAPVRAADRAPAAVNKCAPDGAAAPCDCGGGKTGMQSCNAKVGWSKCSCPKAVVKKCAPNGATGVCQCSNGKAGMQLCDEKVGWSKCSC
ncbi:MAG: hypothetical protein AB7K71_30480 [Polyangiaceae bacterium]